MSPRPLPILGAMLLLVLAMCTEPVEARSLAIVHASVVHPVAGPSFADGLVLVQDGRIRYVGPMIDVPADAEVIDARGKWVTPGIFSAGSQLGLVEIYSVDDTNDGVSAQSGLNAALDVRYGFNPDTSPLAVSRKAGLTRSAVFPRASGSIFAGMGALVHLAAGQRDGAFKPAAFAYLEMGDHGVRMAGGSRSAAWIKLSGAFSRYPSGTTGRDGANGPVDEAGAIGALASGSVPMLMRVQSARDILLALDFNDRHPDVDLVLVGAAEGWRVADEIAHRGVPVIVDAFVNIPTRFELMASTRENARRLAQAGVTIAIIPGEPHEPMATANARSIMHAAGVAIAHGLPWQRALEAVTLNPARIFGVESELGSLEAGKRADIVIWDGDPFELSTRATAVLIDGQVQPLHSRQDRLRDRYLEVLGLRGERTQDY